MGLATGIGLALGAFNSMQSKKANNKARDALIGGYQNGINEINQTLNPFVQAGTDALGRQNAVLGGDYSGFMNSPDYLYARDQAQQGIERGAAARGSLYSGGTNVDLARALSGIASQNLNNYWAKLAGMSSQGLQAGETKASSVAQLLGQQGQARANGFQQNASVNSGLLGSFGNAAGQWLGGMGGGQAGWGFSPIPVAPPDLSASTPGWGG